MLRMGEVLLEKCAGGKCAVCRKKIDPGPAVQLSAKTNGIRHITCIPETDSRSCHMGRRVRRKKLPE